MYITYHFRLLDFVVNRQIKRKSCQDPKVNNVPANINCSKSTIETLKKCEICSKLIIKTPEGRQ